jgi:hypothetical protein
MLLLREAAGRAGVPERGTPGVAAAAPPSAAINSLVEGIFAFNNACINNSGLNFGPVTNNREQSIIYQYT